MTGATIKDLTDKQLEELRQAFNMFDRDGNGTIDHEELKLCLKAMGHYPTDDELKTLMSRIDTDNSGAVDFEEFAAVMANRMDNEHAEKDLEELKSAFDLFDSDRSGRLDAYELQRALKILGIDLTQEETTYLLSEIDADGSGDISWEEFMEYVINFKEDQRDTEQHDGTGHR